ncbi:DUF1799 domain-containing protein [Neisseria sp. HMSC075C12]|uniref:DUF1799 domain-containing protein n=1 Tax=Neisseria sp. HMSC075C12 TaxID=1739282 RepID=UPI0008BB87B7|nr:DUF1799 domain-containing protein [Neisseria sp. HMSC075C12]OFL27849.1 hypothetical protein HMPREF2778_07260 [Neisseria sp. HMSC075C12]
MFSDDEKTVSALSLFGFDDSDVLSDEVEVWPNNWEAVQLFLAVSGQWRVSMAGAYALDYNAVDVAMDMMGVKNAAAKSCLVFCA